MKVKRLVPSLVVMIVVALLSWSALAAETVDTSRYKKEGPYRIGFANGFSGNTWRTEMLLSLELEASKHPEIAELIITDGQGDIAKQIADVESLIAQRVDALLIIPNSNTAVIPVLRRALQQNIPVIAFNLPVDDKNAFTSYIGTDPVNKGRALGQFIVDELGGKGKIVALGGLPGNGYTAAAWQGAQEAFAGKEIEVLTFQDAHWQEDRARVIMADLLTAYPEIDAVWADGGQVAAGAAKAFVAAGRPLGVFTGDDYNGILKLYMEHKEAQPSFKIGLISEPTWESRVALQFALSALKGEPLPKEHIIEPQLITGENAGEFVMPELPDGFFVDTDLPDEWIRKMYPDYQPGE